MTAISFKGGQKKRESRGTPDIEGIEGERDKKLGGWLRGGKGEEG